MNRRAVLLPILVLAVGGAVAWLSRSGSPGEPAPGPVAGGTDGGGAPADAPPVERREVPQPVHARTVPRFEAVPARVDASAPPVVLKSAARAAILEIVNEGDAVKEGDLLARMNPEAWEKALRAAEEKGDAAAVARAKEQLAAMEVRSPVDGVVFRTHAGRGDFPPSFKGEPIPLLVLFDWRKLRFRGSAPEELGEFFERGRAVLLRMGDGDTFAGVVTSVGEPGADGAIPLEAMPVRPPPAAPEGKELAGEILVRTGDQEVLAVPALAIETRGSVSFVRVHQVEGPPVERELTVIRRFEDGWVQVQGLGRFDSVMVPER